MTRRLVAAGASAPIWARDGSRVEGADEDAFTLAVDAIERLGRGPTTLADLDRVDLVGTFPADAEWGITEAFGLEGVEVRRHASDVGSLFEALTVAAGGDPTRPAVVVAVDVASPWGGGAVPGAGAGGVALLFGAGVGPRLLGRSSRSHPVERRPDAEAWVRAAERAAGGIDAESRGTLAVIADAPPPLLLARWQAAFPRLPATVAAWSLPGQGHLPLGRSVHALQAHLPKMAADERLFVAAIRRERTDVLALEVGGPVRWAGDWTVGPGRPLPARSSSAAPASLSTVSEGAYVPRPRYLENLPSRWRFGAERCGRCTRTTFPRRGYCRHCGAVDGLTAIELPHDGLEVEAVTTVGPGAQPTEFDPQVAATGGYAVVLVRLADDARATLQVADADPGAVRVGDRLSTKLRRLYPMEGAWRYGRKAVRPETVRST